MTDNLGAMVKELKKMCGGQTILVGPLRIWLESGSECDMYGVTVATRDKTGGECFRNTMIYLGSVAAGQPPQWLMDTVDTVLLVKRADELTLSEAEK